MANALDLSLPDAPPPRRRAGGIQVLTLLIAVAVLVLLILDRSGSGPGERGGPAPVEETERLERLAKSLEKRTLYRAANEVWAEYMAAADLTPDQRAETLYRRAKCLQQGGDYSTAARCYSEVQDLPLSNEQKRSARQALLECLSALGKEEAREYVARSMAVPGEEEAGAVVALVGGDEITREDLRLEVVETAKNMLRMQGVPLLPRQLAAEAEKIAATQLKDPKTAGQILQQIISRRLLYREGLARGYEQDREIGAQVAEFRRGAIGRRVVEEEMNKVIASIGPTDLSNHYEAHKDRFVASAEVEFSYLRLPDRAAANTTLAALTADPDAAQEWQRAPAAAREGAPVPGLGYSAEITAHLLALDEGQISDRVLEHDGDFFIFRAEKKTAERQLSFEEARGQVQADLIAAKREETLSQLEQFFRQKFMVQIYDKNLEAPPSPEASDGGDADQKEDATP